MEKSEEKTQAKGSGLKIKKFRIRPRLATVKRILKSLLGVKEVPSDLEENLPQEADEVVSKMTPTAFYQTWSNDEIPNLFREQIDKAGYTKAICVSVLVATVGSQVEEEISTLLMNGETNRSNLYTALGEESADLSFQFLFKLLVNDAKQDDCEICEPILIKDGPILSECLKFTNAEQEGIVLDTAQHLSPRFTRVALAAWLPISKKKKQGSLAKKK